MASVDVLSAANQAAQTASATLSSSVLNGTTSLLSVPSIRELGLFPLRVLSKADRLLFTTLPRAIVHSTGLDNLAYRAIDLFRHPETIAAVAAGGAAAGAVQQGTAPAVPTWSELFYEAFHASGNKSYWGMLHYITSRWAFTCFILALVLNRVAVYGSSRQRIVLTWNKRLALRLIPIMLFISQIHQLLQAIRCQTSPEFSLYRHGDNNKYTVLDWSSEGGGLHIISSTLLFWSSDESSCAAIGFSRPSPDVRAKYGSFSLLWPTFVKLGLSHFVENLSCALQQVPTMTEVGLSVFEHSLAFAEAEGMVAHTINNRLKKIVNATTTATASTSTTMAASMALSEGTIPASGTILAITDAAHALTGPHLFNRFNVPVEVLLIALLSCGNSLTSHIISVIGKKHKWRLANTAFWGLCYMTAFSWGFFTESDMVRMDAGVPKAVSGLLHFPTVAIVGFLPHIVIIFGIVVCGLIYLLALLFTAVSLGTNPNIRRPTSLMERVSIAHDNLQAAVQLKSINIRWYEDFYTSLLRIGFAALAAASEAVFLNEGRAVEMRQFTWLEEERLDELDATQSMRPPDEAHFQIVEEYGLPDREQDGHAGEWKSGYEKERKWEKKDKSLQNKDSFVYPNPRTDGVGALQRTTRFYLLFIFLRGILFTIGGWVAFGIGATLDRVGITARPGWLQKVIGSSLKQINNDRDRIHTIEEEKRFAEWRSTSSSVPRTRRDDIDIEAEVREKVASEGHPNPQEVLEQRMYDWWKSGGWYGGKDESGDYIAPSIEIDEDATSVITTTTAASTTDDDQDAWESEPEGARTPTQRFHSPMWSFEGMHQRRSETPASEAPILDNVTLARLLDPQDKESRDEARILSSHLSSDTGRMTRSRYRQQFEGDRAKVLLAGRLQPQSISARRPLESEEEAHVLEQLLITRRTQKQKQGEHGASAQSHEDTTHVQSGPPCVVCQSEPRTIIAWPCRCLTVCEDCRVNLAMNNFGNCVTCRRSVGGFVRLYVP